MSCLFPCPPKGGEEDTGEAGIQGLPLVEHRRLQESLLGKLTQVWGDATVVLSCMGSRALRTVRGMEGRGRLVDRS